MPIISPLYPPIDVQFTIPRLFLHFDRSVGNAIAKMQTKAREYLAKSRRCEERAMKARDPRDKDWQTILARAYRMLADAETHLASRAAV
jgi:hypothetical protein